jgi:glycosyltransferase involved in cell wall biosynthesis
MQAQPLISVILPVYNGEKYLAEAVESICQQGYTPLELIIVDDGSTDRTAEIAHSFNLDVRYVCQPNAGPAAARNTGLGLARGEVIAFQDADDLWPPDKLALQVPRLMDDPALEIISGRVQRIKLEGMAEGKEVFTEFLAPEISYNLGSALYRKSAFDKVGLFDVTMPPSEDVDWWMRARECGLQILILRQITLLYRLHGKNITHGRGMREKHFLAALKKSADRRRQNNSHLTAALPLFTDFDEPLG